MATPEQYDQWDEYLKRKSKVDYVDDGFGSFLAYLGIFFPWTRSDDRIECPFPDTDVPLCALDEERQVAWMVVHLNDHHELPREIIADWLEKYAEEHGHSLEIPLPRHLEEK